MEQGESTRLAGDRLVLNIANVEYPFRWCPAGTFMMGSPESEKERRHDETLHQVTLTRGFWMLEIQVTQVMWKGAMNYNPSRFTGEKLPVENVSWNDCQEYIRRLNTLNITPPSYKFSLPTEAQWEYACRAGTITPYHFGKTLEKDKANYGKNLKTTIEAGSYPANTWGLYNMHGNVWEWCMDWYSKYPSGSEIDPMGTSIGTQRVCRGGSWSDHVGLCRSAFRKSSSPSHRYIHNSSYGIRLSLVCDEVF